jgi:hypothetical protein
VLLFVTILTIGWEWALFAIVVALATGVVTPSYINNRKKFRQYSLLKQLSKKDPAEINRLLTIRKNILSYL